MAEQTGLTTTRRVSDWLRAKRADIQEALGDTADAGQFIQRAISVIVGDDALSKCDPASIVQAVQMCAAMGAAPSTKNTPQITRRVALIPREVRRQVSGKWVTVRTDCAVQPEARWYQEMFGQHPDIQSATARLVLVGDVFGYDDLAEVVVEHVRPDPFASAIPETLAGGYLHVVMDDGAVRDLLTPRERFDRARDGSESWKAHVKDPSKSSPWRTDYHQMALKTVWNDAARRHGASLFAGLSSSLGRRLAAGVAAEDRAAGFVEGASERVSYAQLPEAAAATLDSGRRRAAVAKAQANMRADPPVEPPDPAETADQGADLPAAAVAAYERQSGRSRADWTDEDIDRAWAVADEMDGRP